MTPDQFAAVAASGLYLFERDGFLGAAPRANVTPELESVIRANKAALLSALLAHVDGRDVRLVEPAHERERLGVPVHLRCERIADGAIVTVATEVAQWEVKLPGRSFSFESICRALKAKVDCHDCAEAE